MELLRQTIANLESSLLALGLYTSMRRFLFFFASGVVIEFIVKPTYAFTQDQILRSWCVLNNNENCTWTPIGFFPAMAGLFAAFFL